MKLSKDDMKRIAWLEDHVRYFKECREQALKVQAEQEANRKLMLGKHKEAA